MVIFTFSDTHKAMAAESLLEVPGRLVPLPPEISAGCGLSLLTEFVHETMACLEKNGIPFEGIYEKLGPGQYLPWSDEK